MKKRNEWRYNGDTWIHTDGRRLTRCATFTNLTRIKQQASSSKPQASSSKLDKSKE